MSPRPPRSSLSQLPPAVLIGMAVFVSMGSAIEVSAESIVRTSGRSTITMVRSNRQTAAQLLAKLSDAAKIFRGRHHQAIHPATALNRPTHLAVSLDLAHRLPRQSHRTPPMAAVRATLTDLPPPVSS